MKLADILGSFTGLGLIQGVEADLRQRQRRGIAALACAGAVQLVLVAAEKDYLAELGDLVKNILTGQFREIFTAPNLDVLVGALSLVAGLAIYMTVRWTRFLLRESQAPFRYTFSVEPFAQVPAGAGATTVDANGPLGGDLAFLHHDLIDKLNANIRRFSILDVDALASTAGKDLGSHIQVRGHFAYRKLDSGVDGVQVMTRIRIGDSERPEQQAPRVDFATDDAAVTADAKYRRLRELVYSRVATAIYQQIREDIRQKIQLFPTRYLRAVGLYHEAKDFEESNTVDAYDYAIELYLESLQYFDMRHWRGLRRWLLRRPLLWRLVGRSQLIEARTRLDYCRCLIYRSVVAALAGRARNTLFPVPTQLEQAIPTMRHLYQRSRRAGVSYITYPKSQRSTRREPRFEEHRKALFEALAVSSLAWSQMGSTRRAIEELDAAKDVAPDLAERSPLYLLAQAETTADLHTRLQLLQTAADLAPSFEIVRYRLADLADMQLRMRNELTPARAAPVLAAYQDVLRINPGNIGGYAACGYLHWLLGQNEDAERAYREGLAVKAIRMQTFVGDLNYGLARVAAEAGRFEESFDLYQKAVAADPGVGVHLALRKEPLNRYYDRMVDSILERYERFSATTRAKAEQAAGESARTLGSVVSFVLNDYGNACFQYYVRTGQTGYYDHARRAYEQAIDRYPENAVAHFNLSRTLSWIGDSSDQSIKWLARAERLEPSWHALQTYSIEQHITLIRKSMQSLLTEKGNAEQRLQDLRKGKQDLEVQLRSLEGFQNGPAAKGPDPRVTLDQDLRQRDDDIKTLAAELGEIEAKIGAIRESQRTEILPRLRTLIRTSNLTAFFDLTEQYDLTASVRELMRSNLRNDRLDEKSATTLRILAKLLPHLLDDASDREKLACCESFCRYVMDQFYPDDFELTITLQSLDGLLADRDGEIKAIQTVRRLVAWELDDDAANWNLLEWALGYFDRHIFGVNLETRGDPELASVFTTGGQVPVPVPLPLRKLFREYGIPLSPGAMLHRLEADGLWRISDEADRTTTYCLTHDAGNARLDVRYDLRQREHYLRRALENLHDVRDTRKNAVLHGMLAQVHREAGRDGEAITEFESAIARDPANALYRNQLGQHHHDQRRHQEAAACYRRATELTPDDDAAFSNLALAEAAIGTVAHWRLALEALERAAALVPQTPKYDERLAVLREKLQTAAQVGEANLDRYPVVTPIAVEIAADLIPLIENADGSEDLSPRFTELIQGLRTSLREEFGVRVPGVRVRGNEADLPPSSYIIMLNEIPLVMGTVDPAPLATTGGVRDPLEVIVTHLRAVLCANLPDFAGLQEVANLLEEDPQGLSRDPVAIAEFAQVFRVLLDEQVSIRDLAALYAHYLAARQEQRPLADIVEEMRALPSLVSSLPGNDAGVALYRLAGPLAEILAAGIVQHEEIVLLRLAPETTQELLAAVRDVIALDDDTAPPRAVVVDDPRLRRPLRKLLELEFPRLWVLSRGELTAPDRLAEAIEIGLD